MANNKFFGMEKLSLVDYEGKIACTLFTSRCNFRCPFCHNSSLVEGYDDLECVEDSEIDEYLDQRKKILDAVVITGGEPTLLDNLEEQIIKIRKKGYLVKLDTNGSNFKVLKNLVDKGLIDYVAMDIKNSLNSYFKTIGIKYNKAIEDNIKQSINFLMENHVDYEFRTTLVDELHTKEDIEEMGKLIKGCKRMFLQKFTDRGTCIMDNLHEVKKEKALEYKCILEKYINNVELRGY